MRTRSLFIITLMISEALIISDWSSVDNGLTFLFPSLG